jgi:hypothetical protein
MCCDLEDGANLHFLVCLEDGANLRFEEFHGGYFSFIFSYPVSLDGGFFVPTVD